MSEVKVYDMTHANDVIRESDKSPTLQARMGTGGNQVPLVLSENGSDRAIEVDKSPPLKTTTPIYCLAENSIGRSPESGPEGSGISQDTSFTLNATGVHGVVYPLDTMNLNGRKDDSNGTGIGAAGAPSYTLTRGHSHAVATASAVRKLMPVECERLQGFPDNWSQIPYRGKPAEQCPDAPRYKAIGNSWCVPVVRWIGQRIEKELINENANT